MRPEEEQPDAPPPGRQPASLARLLDDLARRSGWARRLEGARVHALWAEIVGEQLSAHTQPVRLQGGVLVIRADSTVWATQARYLGAQIAERANAVLGDAQVRTISVVTGALKDHGQRGEA